MSSIPHAACIMKDDYTVTGNSWEVLSEKDFCSLFILMTAFIFMISCVEQMVSKVKFDHEYCISCHVTRERIF